jgi:hypothetical protein
MTNRELEMTNATTSHTVRATGEPLSFIQVTFDDDGTERTVDGTEGQSVDVHCDSCGWDHIVVITSTLAEAEERMTALHRSYLPKATAVCTVPTHDHTTPVDREGMSVDPPIPMMCVDCGVPTHYDSTVEDYQHDDPDALPCFLVPYAIPEAQPCAVQS